ncbi:TPA: endoglucanase [Candidatus Sumerlaeota bacterium]|nr:endoglucanase [Candidatus Sumerlaeota bacterium]
MKRAPSSNMNCKTITLTFLSFILCGAISASTAHTGMRNMTSMQIVQDMKLGWNLGNTLDATGSETGWGNPVTTKAMINKIKEAGFRTIRIPVTWHEHIGPAPDYAIEKVWLNRVEEVVNYALDNDMYVILNAHHEDSTWLKPTYASQKKSAEELTKLWTQIANRFKNYSDYLIFETINEPRPVGTPEEWIGGTHENRDVINQYNAVAVKAIRATGGNNANRHILAPTIAASAAAVAVNEWVAPPNDNRVILSLHMYSPYSFSMDAKGTASWGNAADKAALDAELDTIYNKFVKNGRAVVIGEFGTINKDNPVDRAAHAEYFVKAARTRGITPVWWDNGVFVSGKPETYSYGIFNRKKLTWDCPEILKALVKGAQEQKAK